MVNIASVVVIFCYLRALNFIKTCPLILNYLYFSDSVSFVQNIPVTFSYMTLD
jgi:hypothetical protein